jgi:hypothetical protein
MQRASLALAKTAPGGASLSCWLPLLRLVTALGCCVLCIAAVVACSGSTHCAPLAPAKLENLQNPNAIPGHYEVTFRTSAELACMTRAERDRLIPLPGVLPDSPEAGRQLAYALAQSVGGKVIAVWVHFTPISFAIQVRDRHSALLLAKDPRVAVLGATLPLHSG